MVGKKCKRKDFDLTKICRGCLSTDSTLISISDNKYYLLMELLTGCKLSESTGISWLCYRCIHTIKKLSSFRDICTRADRILKDWNSSGNVMDSLEYINMNRNEPLICIQPTFSNTLCIDVLTPTSDYFTESTVSVISYVDEGDIHKNFCNSMKKIQKKIVQTECSNYTDISNPSHIVKQNETSEGFKDGDVKDYDSILILKTNNHSRQRNKVKGGIRKKRKLIRLEKMSTDDNHFSDEFSNNKEKDSFVDVKECYDNKCIHCGAVFELAELLVDHMATCSNVDSSAPSNALSQLSPLARKQPTRRSEVVPTDDLTCLVCGKVYPTIRKLKKHTANHSEAKPHACAECGKAFKQKYQLVAHMCMHTGLKQYICDECGRAYSSSNTLRNHKLTHSGVKRFSCGECGKKFLRAAGLAMHSRTHTGERPYTCDVCGKSFAVERNLVAHSRIHTGERPYSCPVCEKRFTESGTVKSHMRLHTGERPFQCDTCTSAFRTSSDLIAHRMFHTGERPFACDICPFRCRKSYNLKKHRLTHNKTKPATD